MFFARHSREILDQWHRVRDTAEPSSLAEYTPAVLAEVAALARDTLAGRTDAEAHGHALEQLCEGGDLATVVGELSLLRDSVLRVWLRERESGGDDELRAIERSIDRVIAASVARYTKAHERTLAALKEAEERARTVASERERALGKLESMLAVAPVPIAFLDRDLRFLRVNEALAKIDGRSVNEHLGRRVDEVLPGAAPHILPVLQGILESGEPVLNWELKRASPSAPHDVRSFVAHCFPVIREGAVLGLGGIVIEVTERERAEERLREAVRLRDEVLAIVSHDLRNPLGTIKLGAAQVVEGEGASSKTRKCVAMIERSVDRMEHLIEDLLDTAAIRAGRLTVRPRAVDAIALVVEALELQEAAAAEKGVQLQRSLTEHITLLCDRNRALQLLGNLIGNAIKFCDSGHTITVTGTRRSEDALFCVADTGPGIEAHLVPSLFEPYRGTAQELRRTSGLGLYICKGIVEAHGGRIWVETQPGQGARFFFTLPVSP